MRRVAARRVEFIGGGSRRPAGLVVGPALYFLCIHLYICAIQKMFYALQKINMLRKINHAKSKYG